jgi:hypothetical protein
MDNTNLTARLGNKVQGLQPEPTQIVPNGSEYTALTSNALGLINENLKNQSLSRQSFDVVKSPSGGGTAFTVPGLAGDEIQKEITGIILDYSTPRAYWDTPDPVEGTPPVCFSRDSAISFDGKACANCQFNTFGSKDGESNAKACKESVELYLLQPDNIIPIIVRIPVTSKAFFQKYMIRLVSNMKPVCGVVTKLTLEKVTSKAGQPYSQYRFETVRVLSDEETESARVFGEHDPEMAEAS